MFVFDLYKFKPPLIRIQTSAGIVPFIWLLLLKYIQLKLDSKPSSDGMEPVNEFLCKCIQFKLDNKPSSDGIEPVNELKSKYIRFKLDSKPSSDGMELVNELSDNLRYSIVDK